MSELEALEYRHTEPEGAAQVKMLVVSPTTFADAIETQGSRHHNRADRSTRKG
jgi:hypothetical protein